MLINHEREKLINAIIYFAKNTRFLGKTKLCKLLYFLDFEHLLEPFGISRFYTDDWGAYQRNLDPEQHIIGKENTQKIERKHLTLRTRIKRLARKTICFSKVEQMHDIVIGLL